MERGLSGIGYAPTIGFSRSLESPKLQKAYSKRLYRQSQAVGGKSHFGTTAAPRKPDKSGSVHMSPVGELTACGAALPLKSLPFMRLGGNLEGLVPL